MKKLIFIHFLFFIIIIININAQSIEFRQHPVEEYIVGPTCYYICDLDYDGDKKITYKCFDSGKTETIDITKNRIIKL